MEWVDRFNDRRLLEPIGNVLLGPDGRLVSTARPPNEASARLAGAVGFFVFSPPMGSVLVEMGKMVLVQGFLDRQGHTTSTDRVWRLWRLTKLRVPRKWAGRRVVSGRPVAPTSANQVWTNDFVFDACAPKMAWIRNRTEAKAVIDCGDVLCGRVVRTYCPVQMNSQSLRHGIGTTRK